MPGSGREKREKTVELVRLPIQLRVFAAGLLLAVLAVLGLAVAPSRSDAATKPFKIDFNQSRMQIGMLQELPLDQLASTASIEGTIDDRGTVTIPKDNFKFPAVGIKEPVALSAYMAIEDDATGTFNETTGELVIPAKAGIWISVNMADLMGSLEGLGIDLGSQLGPLSGLIGGIGDLTCGFAPMDVTFTTGSNSLGAGAPFLKGTAGPGAITAEWAKLGPFAGRTKILGFLDACQMVRDYAPTLLQGALGGLLPGGLDLGGLDIAALLANLDNVNLGPSSITLTRTVDESVPIAITPGPVGNPDLKLTVSPKHRRVKPGKRIRFTVKVRNTGESEATATRVCMSGPGVGLLVRWRCGSFGAIPAGKSKTRKFRTRVYGEAPGRKAKFRFKLRSGNAQTRNATSWLLIRKR